MTKFTLIDHSTAKHTTGMSLSEAARELLLHDGADYEVRKNDGGGFDLWTRKEVANRGWSKTVIFSPENDEAAAESEIFKKVIASGHWETDNRSVMTDEAAVEMLREQESE